jgi:Leucine-rich repeat (LRR) protein
MVISDILAVNIRGKGLTTLVGYPFPEGVQWLFCEDNQLTSLEGCPSTVTELYCRGNLLKDLIGCPPNLRVLHCQYNQIENLVGCPDSIEELCCYGNRLTSLMVELVEGDVYLHAPNLKDLDCGGNKLRTLLGCPPSVQKVHCANSQLTELRYLPPGAETVWCQGNPLSSEYVNKTIEEIHAVNRRKYHQCSP